LRILVTLGKKIKAPFIPDLLQITAILAYLDYTGAVIHKS